jgi:ABC-2 type transport system permease protein
VIRVIYSLILRSQATRGRLAALGLLGIVGIAVGIGIGSRDTATLTTATRFIDVFGLALVVPVSALVLGSAALGDFIDDGTMVYLWLRPVPRWKLAAAATAATITVVGPLVLVPLVLAAAATGQGGSLVWGTAASAALGVAAYSGLFVLAGIWIRRALLWGLIYIFIWEGFVARAGRSASKLAIRAYTRSVLSWVTDVPLRLADISIAYALIVPLAVGAAALAVASYRLQHQDVA